ncbi:acyl-CoA dehydrogenase family protein [Amycolatopsis sp. PS_44_ISF1]|uniref:acyl-CoA dehydrogenase family protein n=1 Tax=Amycolatopsis sp. PS_44_ISF1 TaxID=2974917 RepID=UPI0028E05584|nr:acyl-CoA dehydrogenase family protein [Amycolatopsis sp. PS_44_ISF1]MDT8912949.1 acyl-CoA/acyl-ACP dehydrogenase [Amycolatopsis sp. PS_44_ISF1]
MTELLTDELHLLERHCREIAPELREPGLAVDRDPDSIVDYLHLPAVELQQAMVIPPEYTRRPYEVDGHVFRGGSCLSRVIVMDRLSYGDPGVLLASPGPSLSGVAVLALGDEAQRERYFTRLTAEPTWTFFALTEHGRGSAAAELTTRLAPAGDGYVLRGAKKYIGNGARAQLGVVFCRRAPGPFGIEAVLVETTAPGFRAELLPIVGLGGVRISELWFDDLPVSPHDVLGAHLRPSRRGLLGARETLLRYRPSLTAMAVGVSDAVVGYVGEQRTSLSHGDQADVADLASRIAVARHAVREVAVALDAGGSDLHAVSAAKFTAVRLAEEATLLAVRLLGPTALLEHPWLAKTYRDVRAFEYMEGAGDVHRLLVFQGVLRGGGSAR